MQLGCDWALIYCCLFISNKTYKSFFIMKKIKKITIAKVLETKLPNINSSSKKDEMRPDLSMGYPNRLNPKLF